VVDAAVNRPFPLVRLGLDTQQHLLYVPGPASLRQVEGRSRQRARWHGQVSQTGFCNQSGGRRRGVEDGDLMAAVRERTSDGHKPRRQTEIVARSMVNRKRDI